MFDIGASELLLTVIVAIVVIGPKELPRALRTAGSWLGKVRRVSGHFRLGVEEMIRQAELQEMEEKWRAQNAAILQAHPDTPAEEGGELPAADPTLPAHPPVPCDEVPSDDAVPAQAAEGELPLEHPRPGP